MASRPAGEAKESGGDISSIGVVSTGRGSAQFAGRPRLGIFLALVALASLVITAAFLVSSDPRAPVATPALPQSASASQATGLEPSAVSDATKRDVTRSHGKLPISFIANKGQADSRVRYYAQGSGHAFYFTPDKVVLSFAEKQKGVALHMTPLGASANATLEARKQAPGKVNHFVGSQRHANIPTYNELAYRELWPGIDLVFRGSGGVLKYEFHVKPGADPSKIGLAYSGADGLSLGQAGALLIGTPLGTLRDSAPRSYQRVGGKRVPVDSRYDLKRGGSAYGFALGSGYDAHRPLVIDPGLVYATYLGGSSTDWGFGVAAEGGNAYVTGQTVSSNFPTTPGAFDTTPDPQDVFVTKLSSDGSSLVYSTFLGGAGGAADEGHGIAVEAGEAYVTGHTGAPAFPTTPGAFDTTHNGADDAFLTKLSSDGSSLVYSTFLGGTTIDRGHAIAVEGGSAYVTGYTGSADFPTTPGAFDPTSNGPVFVTKLSTNGSTLDYSTFLEGSGGRGNGIAVEGGFAYVTGEVLGGFPTTPGAFDTSYNGHYDAFVTKLNSVGSGLVYSTYLGGNPVEGMTGEELGNGIAVESGHAYVTGQTGSADFPTTPGAFDPTYDLPPGFTPPLAFVTKLTGDGAGLVYSTYLGSTFCGFGCTAGGAGRGIAIEGGTAYVTGGAGGSFPLTPDAYSLETCPSDGCSGGFLTRLNIAGSDLLYSTRVLYASPYGVAVEAGSAYMTGVVGNASFLATAGAFDQSFNGGTNDAFVQKVRPPAKIVVKKDAVPNAAQDFSFTTGGGITPSSFILDDDAGAGPGPLNSQTLVVAPGSGYSVAESTPPSNWTQTSATCDDGSPISNITVSEQEVVTCTFTNKSGGIVVRKDAVPDAAQDFSFTAGGGLSPTSFSLDDDSDGTLSNTKTFEGVVPGSGYSVAENTPPSNWTQTSATCDDGSPISNINVSLGELVTCTFTNKSGKIVVVKDTQPDDPQDFSFTTGGGLSPSSFTLDDDGNPFNTPKNSQTFEAVAPGNYSVAETVPGGWVQYSATCDDGSPVSNIAVSQGETVTCTFVNRVPHPRPNGAAKVRVTLVPSHYPCYAGDENTDHGEPFPAGEENDACTGLGLNTQNLTVPNTDSTLHNASVTFRFRCSNAGTPPSCGASGDQAEAVIIATVNDVRCAAPAPNNPGTSCGSTNTAPGKDYTGVLLLELPLRITDRYNGGSNDLSATLTDAKFTVGVPCTGTAGDLTRGSSCSINTTTDSLLLDFAREDQRALLALGQVQILDAGDGTLDAGTIAGPGGVCPPACIGDGGESTFLRQGIFVP